MEDSPPPSTPQRLLQVAALAAGLGFLSWVPLAVIELVSKGHSVDATLRASLAYGVIGAGVVLALALVEHAALKHRKVPRSVARATLAALGLYGGGVAAIAVNRYVLIDRPYWDPLALLASAGCALGGAALALGLWYGWHRVAGRRLDAKPLPGATPVWATACALLAAGLGFGVWSAATAPTWQGSWQEREPTWSSDEERPPNVIILVSDALRYDHVSSHGYHRPTTPTFDRLAAEGVEFTHMNASSSWSLPSVAGMLASRRAGLDVTPGMFGAALRGSTLPEVLSEAGYATLVVSNNPHVTGPYGVRDRFDVVDSGVPGWMHGFDRTSLGRVRRRALKVTDAQLLSSLIRATDEMPQPFFVYCHIMGAHAPYEVPSDYEPPFEIRSTDSPITGPNADIEISDSQLANLTDRYDAMARYADDQIGRLITHLEQSGLADDTIVVYTADHGEAFGDHGHWTHGGTLHRELVNIPFVIWWPGGLEGGRARAEVASLVDLPPTLLALARPDTELPSDWSGVALRPERERGPERRYVVSEVGPSSRALIGDRYKLIRNVETGEELLYDVTEDWEEAHDLSDELPEVAARMREDLAALVAGDEGVLVRDGEPGDVDPELVERLRALGYVQ